MEQALPVYNLALNKVAENMKALQTLADDPDRLYRSLTNSVAGNSTTVMDQLVLAMVRDHDSGVLDATRKLINANNVRKCLRQQEKSLHNAIHHATARDLSNSAFRTSAKMEKRATRQEIADLERSAQRPGCAGSPGPFERCPRPSAAYQCTLDKLEAPPCQRNWKNESGRCRKTSSALNKRWRQPGDRFAKPCRLSSRTTTVLP